MHPKSDWQWSKVKAKLEDAGFHLSSLSLDHGFDPTYLLQVKRKPIPNAQFIIAKALKISPQVIWPSRYDDKGLPVKRIDWLKANRISCDRLVQKVDAA